MPQETPSRDLDKVIVRLPDGMREQLKEAAKFAKRSMNAEIVARLADSFEPGKQREPILYVTSRQDLSPGAHDLGEAIARLEEVTAKLRGQMPKSKD
ncbi:Arc-like DNA binding domain-containing protein [Hyphomicrobiales bacterium]|nr:Arc-like DNA binding domain-containing protein [Hyphomicrobiales bacterium]CAH1700592.1 Arc-like DNA binding domain-containing protein [Hyphomicrobiales bacterium]CAI0344440.1 Arc-like DNA binding domain-containing protein [Hyphomicrobiales bacterium]